jgi:DNA polymerase-3 subunit delta
MPSAAPASAAVTLICGDDEFGVKQRARQLFQQWSTEVGGMDHETIDASVGNSGEALKAIARLREALQTLPFFGGGKVVWLQNCNFLGDERTASSSAVTETLTELAQELKAFRWDNVRLLISAGKVDKRKVFYKTLDKLGPVESFAGLSLDDREWAAKAEEAALKQLRALKRDISDEALARLVNNVGPNARQLSSEVDKLVAYAGDKAEIDARDVDAIVTRNKQARAFALADALGDRDLPRLFKTLDEELWEMQYDKEKSEIGMLYGLISKVRMMIFLKEMVKAGWLKPERDYNRFKSQLERVPADAFPQDRKINPLAANPYVLFRALPQSSNFTQAELVRAMDLLLQCNRRLVSSGLEGALVLQQTLTQIVRKDESQPVGARPLNVASNVRMR